MLDDRQSFRPVAARDRGCDHDGLETAPQLVAPAVLSGSRRCFARALRAYWPMMRRFVGAEGGEPAAPLNAAATAPQP